MFIFGLIVLYSAIKIFVGTDKEFDSEESLVMRWIKKFVRVTDEFHGDKFFIRKAGVLFATPLFVVLAVVEVTDLLFAFDSIPAIFSITKEPWIIYGSNILAVLGLRSLYFLLERMQSAFRFVEKGVALILFFVGAKMIAPFFWKDFSVSTVASLLIIMGILLLSVLASLVTPKPTTEE